MAALPNSRSLRRAGKLALAGLAALSLAACGVQPAGPISAPGGALTAVPTTAPTTGATAAPTTGATAAPTTGATAAPTTAPTGAPTAPPTGGQPGLVGPEWTKIAEGDFDRNGRADVVAYKPSAVRSQVSTKDGFLASEIVVVERRADGTPAVRLLITRDGVSADGKPAASFGTGDGRPAGMIVRLFAADRKLIITQLNSAGQQYSQEVAVGYVEAQGAYAVYGPGGTLPFPLVGPEWTIAANGTMTPGAREGVIAYKPSAVIPSMPGGGDFTVVVSELVIVDRGASGGPAVRLAVTLDGVSADGQLIARFGSGAQRPAGLVARGSFADRSIVLSPIDGSGAQYTQDIRVYWDGGAGAYRVAGPGGQTPGALVGPEWTVAYAGDINANGREDVVAYKPTAARPAVGGRTGDAFIAMASEVVVAERAPDGGVAIRLFADLGSVRADGLILVGNPGVVELHPFSASGILLPGPLKLGWGPDGRLVNIGFPTQPPPSDEISIAPGWINYDGSDRTGDGRPDAVVYFPSSFPVNITPGSLAVAAGEIAVLTNRGNGTEPLLSISNGAAYSGGYLIYTFGDGMGGVPSAYLLDIESGIVVVDPIGADGNRSGPRVQFVWSADAGAFIASLR